MAELTEGERALLDLESQYWRFAGQKEQAIRDRFDLTATRYFQAVNALLDRPEALAYAPITVRRLQRRRGARGLDRVLRARP